MSKLRPLLKKTLPEFVEALPGAARSNSRSFGAPLDLVHLARQSLGDKPREVEMLGRFDQQAGLAAVRLGALDDISSAADVCRMLGASARIAGAFAVAAACDAYAATLLADVADRDRSVALEILQEEIAIAREAISDLLPR